MCGTVYKIKKNTNLESLFKYKKGVVFNLRTNSYIL